MKIEPTSLPDVLLLHAPRYGDERGFFNEIWHTGRFADNGLNMLFRQLNHSRSATGVLRGLHFQEQNPQAKLVSVITGAIFDVAVDIRPDSETYLQWAGVELSGDVSTMLYIPEGFAHGFYTVAGPADVIYQCSSVYAPDDEKTIVWDDPEIGIDWPLNIEVPILSEKDATASTIREIVAER